MTDAIWVAVLSLIGTLVGSLAGILTANRLAVYRIEQLEQKVSKHNGLVERMAVAEEGISFAHRRIDELCK